MYNQIKIYRRCFIERKDVVKTLGVPMYVKDYILQIGDSFYPTYKNDNPFDSSIYGSYTVIFCTSSLDNLEKFILNLMIKTRCDTEDTLLQLLYSFWSSYTGKLSKELVKALGLDKDL